MYSSGLSRSLVPKAMVLVSCPLPNYEADSRSFTPSDLIPIALIRDPGFLPHIPIILFWVPAFPVISPHGRVVPTLSRDRYSLNAMV